MQPLPSLLNRLAVAACALLLVLPGCILVVDADDLYDDHHPHRSRWYVDVIVYYGRAYSVDDGYHVSFDTRDQLSGIADCNEFDAAYDAAPVLGTITIRDIYSTDAACRGNSVESLFFENLQRARTYRIEDDALTLSSRDGNHVLYLSRD